MKEHGKQREGRGTRQRENTVLRAHSPGAVVASYPEATCCVPAAAVRTRGWNLSFPEVRGGFLDLSPEGRAGAERAEVASPPTLGRS